MAERRKGKQKRKEEQLDKPTKEEYAVAKYLRFNLPPKEGKLVGMTVQYFVASKAVDMLMDSQWSTAKAKVDPLFTTRASCVDYMHTLLEKGLFHRAARVEKKKDRDKKKRKLKDSEVDESGKEEDKKKKKSKKGKEKSKEEEKKEEDKKEEKPSKEEKEEEGQSKKEEKDEEKKKSKKDKKVRLEMHELQIFKDGDSDYYVWIYDPVPVKTFIIGLLLVLGAIAVCLFPLWPPEVRLGVYYLSLAAAGFVGVILALCVVRLVLFCVVWGVTFGKHHFWFLPNLTEDVGFFDSFKPLYKHDKMEAEKEDTSNKDKKKKEEKPSLGDNKEEEEKKPSGMEEEKSEEEKDESGSEADAENDGETGEHGENGDNGYEVIDREELEQESEEDRVEEVEEDEESQSEEKDSQETKKDK